MSEITIRGIRMVLRNMSSQFEGWVDAYDAEGHSAFGQLAYDRVEFDFTREDRYPWLFAQADKRGWILDDWESNPDRPCDHCHFVLTAEQVAALTGDQQPATEKAPVEENAHPQRSVSQEFGIGGIGQSDSGLEIAALIENLERTREVDTSTWVRCDCGHHVPQGQRMMTSTGTSCPDCYDRMSEGA